MSHHALFCSLGLMKAGDAFLGVDVVHVEPGPPTVWVCCSADGSVCGPASITTPHVPVPEPSLAILLFAGVAWGVLVMLLGPILGRYAKKNAKRYPPVPRGTKKPPKP